MGISNKIGRWAGLLIAGATLALVAKADILHMKDGRVVEGQVIEETKSLIKVRTLIGTSEFKPSEVERIERGKSKLEEFEERMAASKTGDDFHAVGLWAEQKRMRKQAKQAMRKAVKVQPMHAAANTWLGFVLHEGEWMTPEERDKRVAAAKEADQRSKGLVPYGDRWVTPDDKRRLELGMILVDGEWLTFEESQRAKGLEEFDGRWIERSEALAREHASHAEGLTELPFEVHVNEQVLLAGTVPLEMLEQVGDGLLVGRKWFDEEMRTAAGLGLLGDRRGEFYLFDTRDAPFTATVAYFASLTQTLPEGWSEVAKKSYGFFWTDPYTLSSARQWHRGRNELLGHCYHHWGHMLLGRAGYDGRLLPPWYEEAFASRMEFEIHGKNAVFCRARTTGSSGTVSTRTKRVFDPKMVRDGKWREALKLGIREGQVHSIDKLYQLDFSDLEVLDIATGMGILEWIDSNGPRALEKFHAVYRGVAPPSPSRLLDQARDRQAGNDKAFRAATGKNWREGRSSLEGLVPGEMSPKPQAPKGPEGPPSIPGYELEKELGRGSSGVVYRARQLSVDRSVALKVMHVDRSINARSVKRLQREARIAAHLSHPNLISAIDMGHSGGMWWFAMELVEGPSLAERLEKGGRLMEVDALSLFSQLCGALQHASEKGVVHRDIKPANILLERPDFPRLADLGLARIEDDPMLTRTGATLGTPHYVSPEQARDPALADVRSDIWSLGATMYHAVCGRPPFAGSSMAEILSAVLYSPIPDPLELRPELSRGLGLVLRKCLSRDPDRRYFSPAELGEDLARVAAHKAPAIRRGSLEPLDPTRGERRGLMVGALGLAALGALVVLVILRPWSDSGEGEGAQGTTQVSGPWRPIERFESRFAEGRMSLAAAHAEIAELRERVPEHQRVALEETAEAVRRSLETELADFWKGANEEFQERMKEREFDQGEQLLERGFAQQLVERTGFAPGELPREIDRSSFERRLANLDRALLERREDAMLGALQTVERYVRRSLFPEVDRKRQAGAWNEARKLLASAKQDLCSSAECDRRGLDDEALNVALEPTQAEIERRSADLESAWTELDGVVLFAEVRRLAELAAQRLQSGSDARPLGTFESDFDKALARHGIDRELLASSPSQRALEEFHRRHDELGDLFDERASQVGDERLAQVEALARPLYAKRDYGAAIELWQSVQGDPLLEVVLDIVQVRLDGAQELQAFLRRATAGLEELQGKTISLRQGSITATGKVEFRGDPLERGFRLRETGGSPLVYLLVPSKDIDGTLLDSAAIERFATQGGNLETDIGLQLQRALFRFHEGDFAGASELLASEALQGGALIYYDLGLRVAQQLGEEQGVMTMRRSRAAEEVERLTGPDAEAMDPDERSMGIRRLLRDYRDVLGDRAESILLQTRRSLEMTVPPSTLEDFRREFQPSEVRFPQFGRVEMLFDFQQREVGVWEMGDWFFTGESWGCSRRSDLAQLESRPAPRLTLGDPLLVDSGSLEIGLSLHQPKDSPPELLAISALGFHAVFAGPLGDRPAHFLSDTSSLLDVARRARDGEGEPFAGFKAGEDHEVNLWLSRGSGKLVVTVDGVPVDSSFHRPPAADAQTMNVRVRSIDPVEMRRLSIQGDRR